MAMLEVNSQSFGVKIIKLEGEYYIIWKGRQIGPYISKKGAQYAIKKYYS